MARSGYFLLHKMFKKNPNMRLEVDFAVQEF